MICLCICVIAAMNSSKGDVDEVEEEEVVEETVVHEEVVDVQD